MHRLLCSRRGAFIPSAAAQFPTVATANRRIDSRQSRNHKIDAVIENIQPEPGASSGQIIVPLADRFRELLACFEEVYASRPFAIGDALLRRAAKWIFRRRTRFVIWSPEKVAMLGEAFRAWESRAKKESEAGSPASEPMAGSGLIAMNVDADQRPEPDPTREIAQLRRWAESLIYNAEALLASPQWRVGSQFAPGRAREMEGRIRLVLRAISEDLHPNVVELGTEHTGERSDGVPLSADDTEGDSKSLSNLSVDVVVCIHGALPYVQRCVESVLADDSYPYRLLLMDDGSEDTTSSWLKAFAEAHENVIFHREEHRTGYTMTANRALRLSNADLLILLNSDTMVPSGWIEKLIECGYSDERIGIFGPLSNIGGWQSLPHTKDDKDRWIYNSIPTDSSISEIDRRVERVSQKAFPRVPLLNGFCFAIRREVMDAIGCFDEDSFPEGFHEEYDYCLRAAAAGFDIAIADHTYVYHEKSRSYTAWRREELVKAGRRHYHRKHGRERARLANEVMRNAPDLRKLRKKVLDSGIFAE